MDFETSGWFLNSLDASFLNSLDVEASFDTCPISPRPISPTWTPDFPLKVCRLSILRAKGKREEWLTPCFTMATPKGLTKKSDLGDNKSSTSYCPRIDILDIGESIRIRVRPFHPDHRVKAAIGTGYERKYQYFYSLFEETSIGDTDKCFVIDQMTLSKIGPDHDQCHFKMVGEANVKEFRVFLDFYSTDAGNASKESYLFSKRLTLTTTNISGTKRWKAGQGVIETVLFDIYFNGEVEILHLKHDKLDSREYYSMAVVRGGAAAPYNKYKGEPELLPSIRTTLGGAPLSGPQGRPSAPNPQFQLHRSLPPNPELPCEVFLSRNSVDFKVSFSGFPQIPADIRAYPIYRQYLEANPELVSGIVVNGNGCILTWKNDDEKRANYRWNYPMSIKNDAVLSVHLCLPGIAARTKENMIRVERDVIQLDDASSTTPSNDSLSNLFNGCPPPIVSSPGPYFLKIKDCQTSLLVVQKGRESCFQFEIYPYPNPDAPIQIRVLDDNVSPLSETVEELGIVIGDHPKAKKKRKNEKHPEGTFFIDFKMFHPRKEIKIFYLLFWWEENGVTHQVQTNPMSWCTHHEQLLDRKTDLFVYTVFQRLDRSMRINLHQLEQIMGEMTDFDGISITPGVLAELEIKDISLDRTELGKLYSRYLYGTSKFLAMIREKNSMSGSADITGLLFRDIATTDEAERFLFDVKERLPGDFIFRFSVLQPEGFAITVWDGEEFHHSLMKLIDMGLRKYLWANRAEVAEIVTPRVDDHINGAKCLRSIILPSHQRIPKQSIFTSTVNMQKIKGYEALSAIRVPLETPGFITSLPPEMILELPQSPISPLIT